MSKTAAAVNKVMCEALSGQPHLSVTPDRGKEFSKHALLKKELKKKLALPLLIIVGTFIANYFFNVNLMYAVIVDAVIGFFLLRDKKYA